MAKVSTTVVAKKKSFGRRVLDDWQLILLALPGFIFYIIFRYGPMYGVSIAFKDYGIFLGIFGSPWEDPWYYNFQMFFTSGDFWPLLRNTFLIGVYSLFWGFPVPIIFALFLNEIKNVKFKKTIQTITYLPALLSMVVVCSMAIDMLSPSSGIINKLIEALGGEAIYFMIKPEWFRTILIVLQIWHGFGNGAIIYIAALGGVDPQLYEAATIDGCSRLRCIWHVSVPAILPTVVTMFIMRSGSIIKIGYEQVLLLYNAATYEVADIFGTFVYRKGILETNYSYSTAVSLFESIIALFFVITSNTISKKVNETSLW
ncbi:MAG: sugar ABC transporter permease [Ruminococcaceae bacterium]|nr:sugar ABC transporter permease [Oscillospiraceae bacterium]